MADVDEFNKCLEDIEMDDIPAKGFWYTWSNKRGDMGDNKSKIDRVLSNLHQFDKFPETKLCFKLLGFLTTAL